MSTPRKRPAFFNRPRSSCMRNREIFTRHVLGSISSDAYDVRDRFDQAAVGGVSVFSPLSLSKTPLLPYALANPK